MIKKIFKIIFTLFLATIIVTFLIVFDHDLSNKLPVELKQDVFNFEYGSKIPDEIDDYFIVTYEEKIDECSLEIPNDLKIGTNEAKLHYKDQVVVFTINIEDTQYPEIILKEEKVEVDYGENYDINSNIKSVKDPVDGDVEYNIEGEIDYNKAGEYKINVLTKDVNNNTATKSFIVVVKEEVKKQNPSNNTFVTNKDNTQGVSSNKKQHYINSHNIIKTRLNYDEFYDWNPNIKIYRDMIINRNDGKLYFVDTASFALVDFMVLIDNYLNYKDPEVFIYENGDVVEFKDEKGSYIQVREDRLSSVKNAISKRETDYSKHRIIYRDTIVNALASMDLYCSDKEMVDQINNWIIKNIKYKITNNRNYFELFSVDGYKGQCYHYATLFKDMVKAVGINVTYEEGIAKVENHAWNTVTIDGKKYYFDVTWNASCSDNRWSWVNSSEFSKTHKQ